MAPSLKTLIISNFDAYQKQGASRDNDKSKICRETSKSGEIPKFGGVEAKAALLRKEILALLLKPKSKKKKTTLKKQNDENIDPAIAGSIDSINRENGEEIARWILQCVDASFGSPNSSSFAGSIDCVLQLASILSCILSQGPKENKKGSKAIHFHTGIPKQILVKRAIESSEAELDHIRSRSCRLLGFYAKYSNLALLESGACKNSPIGTMEPLAKAILPRLTDKSQIVRSEAIYASQYLFLSNLDAEKTEKESRNGKETTWIQKIEEALLQSAAFEPSVANRSAAVQSLPINDKTIPFLLERVRDLKPKVRVDTLQVFKEKVAVQFLSEEQRIELLRCGLTERCPLTHAAACKMLCCGWMKSLKFDVINLLDHIDPIGNESNCEIVIKTLLSIGKNNDVQLTNVLQELSDPEARAFREAMKRNIELEVDNLSVSSVLFHRVRCENLCESERALELSRLLPDLPVICDCFQKHLDLLMASKVIDDADMSSDDADFAGSIAEAECFICLQLLHLACVTDNHEEGGRRQLHSLLRNLLISLDTPDDLIEPCIKAINITHDSEADSIRLVAQVLDEIVAGGSEKENCGDDFFLQMRALSVMSILLENIHRLSEDDSIQSMPGLILPAILSTNPKLREQGVNCIGKYSLLSDPQIVNDEFKPLLLKIAGNEDENQEVRGQAVLALCDIHLVFAEEVKCSNEGIDLSSLLLSLLNHSKKGIVVIAAEACAKLFYVGRLRDPKILACLILVYFDKLASYSDDSDADQVNDVGSPVRLEQLLSLFFPAYSMKGENRKVLLESVSPLLDSVRQVILPGNKKSVSVGKMLDYICTSVMNGEKQELDNLNHIETNFESNATVSTMVAISDFLVSQFSELQHSYIRNLCKVLASANVDDIKQSKNHNITTNTASCGVSLIQRLKKNIDEIESMIESSYSDKVCLGSLGKLIEILESIDSDNEDDTDTDESMDGGSSIDSSFDPKFPIGTKIRKFFEGYGYFEGTVIKFNKKYQLYKIEYGDGDKEELTEEELIASRIATDNETNLEQTSAIDKSFGSDAHMEQSPLKNIGMEDSLEPDTQCSKSSIRRRLVHSPY